MYKLSGSKHINLSGILEKGKNIYDDIPAVKRKRQARKILKALKYISLAIIAISLLLIIFFSVHIINIKLIYSGFTHGQDNLFNAAMLFKSKNYKTAISRAKLAENYFNSSLEIIEDYHVNFLVKKTNFASKQFNDLLYLFSAGELLSRAVQISADYSQALDPVKWQKENFYTLAPEKKEKILQEIYNRGPELNGVKANIALARLKLDNIKFIGVLGLQPIRISIQNLSNELMITEDFLDKAVPLTSLIPYLLGYPNESNSLIVFEDSRELWPSGGKISAIGVFNLKNGEIISLDSYSLNEFSLSGMRGPLISPASPLNTYLGLKRWTLTEANWTPDWPQAVSRIEYFLNRTPICNNKKITGAIAVNSEALSEILALNGPVYIDNIKYDKNNFISLYNENNDARLLGRLTKELLNNILNKPMFEVNKTIELVSNHLSKKNIILNFKDAEAQTIIKNKGWSGEFSNSPGDFLAVIDANIGKIKNDRDISRKIVYKVEESINGYFSELNLSYANTGGEYDYKNYFRIYTPLGSSLLNISDFTRKNNVKIYNELDKTVFSGFIRVLPNTIKNIRFEYRLPDITSNYPPDDDRYMLYVEKQPGNATGQMTVDVSRLNKVKSYQPTGFNVYRKNNRNVRWESDFETDKTFVVETGN